MTSSAILKKYAGSRVPYLSKSLKMRATFIAFVILLILGMIQVGKGGSSVRAALARNRTENVRKSTDVMSRCAFCLSKAESISQVTA